jgi:stage II sporulation protein AA (anti-sigma F factor antagonist)
MIGGGPPHVWRATRFRDQKGCRVLSLAGELDISARDATERDLRGHIAAVPSAVIIVDLSAVTFIDSAGLDPLVRAHAELAETDRVLALRSVSGAVDVLLRLLAANCPDGLAGQTVRANLTPLYATPEADHPGEQAPGRLGRQASDLRAAMHDNAMLNESIGLLMAVHECNPEQARLLLELVSARHEITITELAMGIVATAEATRTQPPGMGPVAVVPAVVRDAVASLIPAPRPRSLGWGPPQ